MKKFTEHDDEIQKYRQSAPLQQMIVQILAVQYYEFRQTHVIHCLHALGYKDTNKRKFTHQTIRPHLLELADKGWVIKSPQGLKCPEFLWREAIHDTLSSGRFSEIAKYVLECVPLPSSQWSRSKTAPYEFKKYEIFFSAFQMALLGGPSVADLDKVYRSGKINAFSSVHPGGPCHFLLNTLFEAGLVDTVDLSVRWKALPYLLKEGRRNWPRSAICSTITSPTFLKHRMRIKSIS